MAATQALAEASGGEVVFEGQPWNSNTVDLIRLARSHCLLVLHSTFADSVAQLAAQVLPQISCKHFQTRRLAEASIVAHGLFEMHHLAYARRERFLPVCWSTCHLKGLPLRNA